MTHVVPLRFPGFSRHFEFLNGGAYSFRDWSMDEWFCEFRQCIVDALAHKRYFPVYRMGDGEYAFAVGNYLDLKPFRCLKWRDKARKVKRLIRHSTARHVSGYADVGYETYAGEEFQRARSVFMTSIRRVAEHGYLALGLDTSDLYRNYFPEIVDWFQRCNIRFECANYVHVYAVYALMQGPAAKAVLNGQRVLIISGFIEDAVYAAAALRKKGAAVVEFEKISATQSMFDAVDVDRIGRNYDVVLVSAGVGAVNILAQLHAANVVCIDIGYLLRVFCNDDLKWDRPFCVPDDEFFRPQVRFIAPSR